MHLAFPKPAPTYKRVRLLDHRARQMRHAMTESETALWQRLAGRRLLGVAFRRQVRIGQYIVDFCAPSERFVVEVEGPYHARRLAADARRERATGWYVLRLPAEMVLTAPDVAVDRIRTELAVHRGRNGCGVRQARSKQLHVRYNPITRGFYSSE